MSPRRLACPACGATYSDRWRCACGAPLSFSDPPVPTEGPPPPAAVDARGGLWGFDDLLAVGDDPADRVTLGEGMTPLVDADGRSVADSPAPDETGDDETGAGAGPWNAAFKLEYVFPTGSFKDRGATTTLTRARELGVERVVEDSSGNAGAAIATYAARAGIAAEIYVPADVKEAKLRAIRRAGAEPVRVEGSRADVTDACLAALGDDEEGADTDQSAWYASHAWNPAFFEGTATIAYEIAAQRDWTAPDAIVTPLGHGTLFLGAYRGFRRLERAGWITEIPRLYGAQAAGVAPIVRERHGPDAADPDGRVNAAADGIQIAEPVRSEAIHAALDGTGGDAIAVTETDTASELDRLHAAGFYTEPTCAVAPAALRALRDRNAIAPDDDVVVPLTGSGLKT
ncbi:pyridoxal-phosphate dependent enzyme [Halorubrum laminariae]|uniref:Pyridoxal-phosphate dependent enzyme n=1 Tax=Halorubrum laminariae TaxID=1433523 RepID=A0ABD6C056_9EURY|nr:pyridoxal-phosphate dependent enzyme [Halorubrum laminariae]